MFGQPLITLCFQMVQLGNHAIDVFLPKQISQFVLQSLFVLWSLFTQIFQVHFGRAVFYKIVIVHQQSLLFTQIPILCNKARFVQKPDKLFGICFATTNDNSQYPDCSVPFFLTSRWTNQSGTNRRLCAKLKNYRNHAT